MQLRPEILSHPTIPKPLHGLNPRTILGKAWWDIERKKAYAASNYHCMACGVAKQNALYHPWLEAHELYKIDYVKGTSEMTEIVALCHACHNFIHTGRLLMLVQSYKISPEKAKKIVEHGMNVLSKADKNKLYPKVDLTSIEIQEWSKWRLIIDGKAYKPLFKNQEEWELYYKELED